MLSRHMLTVVVKVNGQKVDADNKDADESAHHGYFSIP